MGSAIAFAGENVMISSPYYGNSVGAAMHYSRSSSSAAFKRTTQFLGPNSYEKFGSSVAIGRDHVFVGAPSETCYIDNTPFMGCGVVFAYANNPSQYSQNDYSEDNNWYRRSIFPPVASQTANFGSALAASVGGLLAVGAPGYTGSRGAVYVFQLSEEDVWENVAFFESPSLKYFGRFGFSVSFYEEGLLVVGAPGDTVGSLGAAGSVSVFRDLGAISGSSSWGLVTQLFAAEPIANAEFGTSVSVHRSTIVVGSQMASGHSEFTGAVYVFEYSPPDDSNDPNSLGKWTQTDKLIAFDGEAGDMFGCSVSIRLSTIAVGACGENGKMTHDGQVWQPSDGDNCGILSDPECVRYVGAVRYRGEDAGAVYVFGYGVALPDKWVPVQKVLPAQSGRHWRFGWAVETNGDTIIVSADGAGSAHKQQGAVYEISIDWSDMDDTLAKILKGMLIGAGVISAVVFAYVFYVSRSPDFFSKRWDYNAPSGTAIDVSSSGRSATSSQFLLGNFLGGSSSYAPSLLGGGDASGGLFDSRSDTGSTDSSVLSSSERGLGHAEWGISRPPRRVNIPA